jgi:hypothetical protein
MNGTDGKEAMSDRQAVSKKLQTEKGALILKFLNHFYPSSEEGVEN